MDMLTISKLKISTIIGVYPHEKEITQDLFIDLSLSFDASLAAKTDDLQHTIDYDQLTRELKELLEQESFNLIETVAEQSARFCLSYPAINKVTVTVAKPSALERADNVAITIARKKN